jgi:beta-galactosidase
MARVTVAEGKGLRIDGAVVPLLSGTLHYWRHPPDLWPSLLKSVKSLGFPMVETYIPWGVHEVSRRSFDFGGLDHSLNLERFIQQVKKTDLRLIVRPGPHINAELTDFGYPRRIVTDPEIIAHEAHGGFAITDTAARPFGIPSYASRKFYEETAFWFDALAPILKRNLYPQGPIIAVQVDNETGYIFRLGAYLLDYHPDSIGWYRRFLRDKYGDVGALNERYGATHTSFETVEPPRRFTGREAADLPYHLDWVKYKDWQILEALKRLKGMWVERGVEGVPFFQNYFSETSTPFDLAGTEREPCGMDIAGLDDYSRKEPWVYLAEKALFLSATSRLPFVPEFGAGSWAFPAWRMTLTLEDTRFTAPFFFMFGVKAMNHYMAVERDRWMGSPIAADGALRKEAASFYRGFNAFLKGSRLHELILRADLLILANRDADRIRRAVSVADGHPFFPLPMEASFPEDVMAIIGFSPDDPPGRLRKASEFALKRRIPFAMSDTNIPAERLERYKAVILPTYGFLDREVQERMRSFVEDGGFLVIGPSFPRLDGDGRPFGVFSAYRAGKPVPAGKGSLLFQEEWEEGPILEFLAAAGVVPLLPSFPPGILAACHEGKGRRILFIANPSGQEMTLPPLESFEIAREGDSDALERGGWKTLWGGLRPRKNGGDMVVPPWTVAAWEKMPAGDGKTVERIPV